MIQFLQLMQLSDSALPIGTASHSFGLESLAEWDEVRAQTLSHLLRSYLAEQGLLDACYCRNAQQASARAEERRQQLTTLCRRLSAARQARESRSGSISLGRRLLAVCASILPPEDARTLADIFEGEDPHYAIVFGAMATMLGFDEDLTVAALLQQGVAAMVSAAQRLMPVGQRQAAAEQWSLKRAMIDVVERSRGVPVLMGGSFMPMMEIASMRHPRLETRLFLS